MEYTRSKGEHSYETFEGTPEEIAKLIKAIDKGVVEPNGDVTMKTATALPTPCHLPHVNFAESLSEITKANNGTGFAVLGD